MLRLLYAFIRSRLTSPRFQTRVSTANVLGLSAALFVTDSNPEVALRCLAASGRVGSVWMLVSFDRHARDAWLVAAGLDCPNGCESIPEFDPMWGIWAGQHDEYVSVGQQREGFWRLYWTCGRVDRVVAWEGIQDHTKTYDAQESFSHWWQR